MFSIRRWIAAKMFAQQAVAGESNGGLRRLFVNSPSRNLLHYPPNLNTVLQFYYADEELNMIAAELDSFDGRRDPLRCTNLVNQLRSSQDNVISLLFRVMDEWKCERAVRDYRSKFPEDLLSGGDNGESLNGQIWFGAECLAAGSNIMNHEMESEVLRPMAKTLTAALDQLRLELRHHCTMAEENYSPVKQANISLALIRKMEHFDRLFTDFEFEYVRSMLPIKSVEEIEKQQELTVLFSETVSYGLKKGLLIQNDLDECQPRVMIYIPRLAILYALVNCGRGNPLLRKRKSELSNIFKPFHKVIHRLNDMLQTLSSNEIFILEKILTSEGTDKLQSSSIPAASVIKPDPTVERLMSVRRHSYPTEHCSGIEELGKSGTLAPSPKSLLTSKKCASTLSKMNLLGLKVKESELTLPTTVDNESTASLETTTSHNSTVDSFELALALGAKNSDFISGVTRQLLQKLFVNVASIADQLQSNSASDLRVILRDVFRLCCDDSTNDSDEESVEEAMEAQEEDLMSTHSSTSTVATPTDETDNRNFPSVPSVTNTNSSENDVEVMMPPVWVPDEMVSSCTTCNVTFTLIRRRHHCRNCGQIYCSNCSDNFTPLIQFGFHKAVRVCDQCFMNAAQSMMYT